MNKMYGSYSDEDLNDWEQFPQNAKVLTSSAFGAWLMRRDERRDKRKLEQIRAEIAEKENALNYTTVSDVALKTAYIEVLKIIDKAIKEPKEI